MFFILETEDMETQRNQQRPRTADVRKENQKLKMELEKERESHKKTTEEFDRLKSHKGYR